MTAMSRSQFDFILFERGHHPLELVAVDRLERAVDLAQQQHLVGVVRALDQVVGHALAGRTRRAA